MTLVGVLKLVLNKNDDEVDETLHNFFCKMFLVGKAICFLLAVLFTIIAVITNSQNNTRRVPPPKPFFNRELWVEDFYGGELYYALLKASKYDVIFLMLYAPWDADSQNARAEFETTCRYFGKKVYCAAVNCWQSHSGCKAFFDDIAMYPVFVVDLHSIPSITYSGEINASHMIRFLNSVIEPIERISSVEKFDELQNSCDALVVSYLPHYEWYKKYYQASLRILEFDPRREVCWTVITDSNVARSLNVSKFSVKLHSWNDSSEFDDAFTTKSIVKWVKEHVQMLTQWLFFTNARRDRLADFMRNKKAVILFTPRNMHLKRIPTYLLFKEAVVEFKSCFANVNIDSRRASIANERRRKRSVFFTLLAVSSLITLNFISEIVKDYEYWERMCAARFIYKTTTFNSSIFDVINENYEKYVFTSSAQFTNTSNQKCHEGTLGWKHFLGVIKSKFTTNVDDSSARSLVLNYIREKCRQLNMLKRTYEYSYLSSKLVHPAESAVPDALCSLNDTYSFFAIDSLLYPHVAHSLGIDLSRKKDLTTVVVFNNKNEEVFVATEEFNNKRVLHDLLIQSAHHLVPRWFKSTSNSHIYLHRYNRSSNINPDEIAVRELTSESFQSVVFNASQHVVVYYYSPYCSYCQVSAYTFLYVARALKNYPRITFTRVDSENNDLAWNLVPQSYPSIIIFPARRKSENAIFPADRELTTDNLLDFVLSNVEVEVKMNYTINECNEYRIQESTSSDLLNKCVNNAKIYCLRAINNLVRSYRKILLETAVSVNNSSALESLLSRVKYLKSVYFHLDQMGHRY